MEGTGTGSRLISEVQMMMMILMILENLETSLPQYCSEFVFDLPDIHAAINNVNIRTHLNIYL